jgi:hypothetical protein
MLQRFLVLVFAFAAGFNLTNAGWCTKHSDMVGNMCFAVVWATIAAILTAVESWT